ncbi:MAG: protoglobin domain-containing protein [Myxococcota bacterium]
MTDKGFEIFEQMKAFLSFGAEDAAHLRRLGPLMMPHQPRLTDAFYAQLALHPPTAKLIEGRVQALKQTHAAWFAELFNGEYGRAYFDRRWRIGLAHVRIGLDPFWVEVVMSLIRGIGGEALSGAPDENALRSALLKILDLDLLIINLSYQEDRLDRLTEFTGLKRPLIENIIRIPRK